MRRKNLTCKEIIKILKRYNDVLKKYSVKRIGLFGSYATGEQNEESDIDLLVEFEEPTFDNFMGLIFYLEDLFGKKVEVLTPDGIESIRIKKVAEDIKRSLIYV